MNPTEFLAVRRESLVKYLAHHTSAEVRFDDTSRQLYSTDASHYRIVPLGVVVPRTVADLRATVQIAAELNVPITARGAGTSLTGQSIGAGIVLDCSKYLHAVGAVDIAGRRVAVQPGAVLEHLNAKLAPHDLMFGPDVATINRATLGGMIGNNSAGARSVLFGQTVDHVKSLTMILADGTMPEFRKLSEMEREAKEELATAEGHVYREVGKIVRGNADEIEKRTPKILRKVSGYNLAGLLPENAKTHANSLVPVLVGSEGTLGVIAGATLNLVPRPKQRGLLVPHFDSLGAALDALAICLEFQPSAVELMDSMLIDLARSQRSLSRTMAAIHGRPAALLMVEFFGDTVGEVEDCVEKLAKRLSGVNGMSAAVRAVDPALRDPLWSLRSAAVPLLYGMPGDGKPVTFVEDCAVAPERLPEFAARFREIFQKHGTDGAFYGHASVGCLHIRPVLNLHDRADIVRMRAIMTDVTDLVLEFNGSLSGEHGDGLVRSEWNRKMFGDRMYDAFRQVKRAFDPANVFNPGKIVDGPAMEKNLRFVPGAATPETETIFDYSEQGGFFRSIELCNGAGVCRKTQGGAMCPSYRATLDERDSTRGRANALRIALSEPTEATPLASRWLAPVMDLCLSCKACKAECPSNVDLAKLKAEFQQAYYAKRTRPLGHTLVKNVHRLSPMGARFAGLSNWIARRSFTRGLLQGLAGIDRRRSLPEFHAEHFRKWFAMKQSSPRPTKAVLKPVVLLDDCFTTFQEPQIGRAAVTLLERAGYSVTLASVCCGRAMISKGYLRDARDLAKAGIAKLAVVAAQGVPILGLEPSCILTLADEWPELVPGAAADAVAKSAQLAESFLAKVLPPAPVTIGRQPVLFHPHCHQRALVGVAGTMEALAGAGCDATALDAGCCGMAGAFGYEKQHYDLSVRIANLDLIPRLNESPGATIVATGTSCRHQIRDLTGRTALHPLEVMLANSRPAG